MTSSAASSATIYIHPAQKQKNIVFLTKVATNHGLSVICTGQRVEDGSFYIGLVDGSCICISKVRPLGDKLVHEFVYAYPEPISTLYIPCYGYLTSPYKIQIPFDKIMIPDAVLVIAAEAPAPVPAEEDEDMALL